MSLEIQEAVTINEENLLIPNTKFSICYAYSDIGNEEANTCVKFCVASIKHTYSNVVNTYHIKYKTEKQFLLSTRTQLYMKMRNDIRGNLIFIDTDVIAYNAIPDDIWDMDFDIGLTPNEENWPLMPFNSGVMFVKDTPEAAIYMKSVAHTASNVPEGMHWATKEIGDYSDWWIDQLSIANNYYRLKDQIKFIFFNKELFNYIPEGPQATDAYFVHCKGSRKSLMKQYLCGILGSDYVS